MCSLTSAALPDHAKVITYPGGRKGQLSRRFEGGQRDHGHSGAPRATTCIAAGLRSGGWSNPAPTGRALRAGGIRMGRVVQGQAPEARWAALQASDTFFVWVTLWHGTQIVATF